ncbi:hypothetical protein BLOT_013935 [Blomia tropicalis]|nr:hypothetical protein BLOT_013935 [Blomia tropicalis]
MKFGIFMLTIIALFSTGYGWNNGLLLKPPMGWMSWMKYACNIDCKRYPHECIDEQLYKDMIDHLASDGYFEAGYKTVNIDDCWSEHARDPTTSRLVPDRIRFPNGIHSLAQYAHNKQIELGIYSDVGTLTCGGYPGTRDNQGHDYTLIDAQTFSEWEVDSLKLDGCYQEKEMYNVTYPEFTKALAQQKHKIAYACSWPAYLGLVPDDVYKQIRENCNYWRNYGDIVDSWNSVSTIINFYGEHGNQYAKFHGPGGWFDPDMLIIGNDGLSYEQSKTQMAFWCLWSAPLLMSNDLRNIRLEMKEILLNKHLIAIDQDRLGIMGTRVWKTKNYEQSVWAKKLSRDGSGPDPYAIIYYNTNTLGVPSFMSHRLSDIIPNLNTTVNYSVYDLYDDYKKIAELKAHDILTMKVKTSGSVRMVKLVPEV